MTVRVLLVRFSSLGDVVLASSVVRAITARYPDAVITFATKAEWSPIAARMPGVERVMTLGPDDLLRVFAARIGRDDTHRVDLHASLRSRALRMLLGGRWGVFRPQSLRRRWMAWRHRTSPPLPPVGTRYLAAARAAGLDVTDTDPGPLVRPTATDQAAARDLATGSYVVLCPGAAHRNKQWPPRHWDVLAHRFRDRGLTVVATGTAAERTLIAAPHVRDAFGLPLGATAALLAGATRVVANDSGLLHLATAVGAPATGIFGPTHPALGHVPWPAQTRIVARDLPCRPCSVHGGRRCPLGHHRCLAGLEPALVA